MEIKRERFVNFAEFVRVIDPRPVNDGWRGHDRSSRRSGEGSWSGADTWQEAVEIAQRGYADAVDKVKAAVKASTANVFERVEARPVRPVCSYVGGSPCVPRAIQGLPRDMRAMSRRDKKSPGVTLVYDVCAASGVSSGEIIDAGARMVALVRLFERAQVPVRLVVSDVTIYGSDGVCAPEIVIKDFHAPFNIQKIAYALAHPSMLRRLVFAWAETTPLIKNYHCGYGRVVRGDDLEAARAEYAARGEFWFHGSDFKTDADVVRAWERVKGCR